MGEWYYYSAAAHAGLGNTANAIQFAKRAIELDPDNVQYRQLYNQLQMGAQWYTQMGNGYGFENPFGSTMGKVCATIAAINLLWMCCLRPC